ncbi:MAG: type II toxin-antitoxin system RelB/DinJ family antitoxin [Bacteroidaceae bacterium]|nr:type II toxin-antitoxin system RelB/DinJ family antitoxin [Bacteroidaceae bacterium]
MSTISTTIRIDSKVKQESAETLESLGMTISEAVNIFLHQVVLHKGLPFEVKYPDSFNKETLDAMAEAKRLSKDPNARKFDSIEQLMEDLEK